MCVCGNIFQLCPCKQGLGFPGTFVGDDLLFDILFWYIFIQFLYIYVQQTISCAFLDFFVFILTCLKKMSPFHDVTKLILHV